MGQLVRAVAAGRRAKELFKSIKSVSVKANPFDESAATAREFLRRVRTTPVLRANPKLDVKLDIVEEYGTPVVDIGYPDGSSQQIRTAGMRIEEIVDEVERVARWKHSGAGNPFARLRDTRAKILGLQ